MRLFGLLVLAAIAGGCRREPPGSIYEVHPQPKLPVGPGEPNATKWPVCTCPEPPTAVEGWNVPIGDPFGFVANVPAAAAVCCATGGKRVGFTDKKPPRVCHCPPPSCENGCSGKVYYTAACCGGAT